MDRILGAWMLHRLCDTIMAQCQGWEAAGKHTMIVCDELSMLSSADDSSLAHIKDQMRSFGVIAVFATQYPEQLSDLLLRSFMGYATFIAFKTPEAPGCDARRAVRTRSGSRQACRAHHPMSGGRVLV